MSVICDIQRQFDAGIDRLALDPVPGRVLVAVSGGSDSVALLLLTQDWAMRHGVQVSVVTVDHQLRRESGQEADWVHRLCDRLGLPHRTVVWDDWQGQGNKQAAARAARYRLIRSVCPDPATPVFVGHTLDDQAETVLMRIKRGSGVDGLAAMVPRRRLPNGLELLRPMLEISRADLRRYLAARGQTWCDDPSNDNPDYDRIRMRHALPHLAQLGLDPATLSKLAHSMQRAGAALSVATQTAARDIVIQDALGVKLSLAGLFGTPDEIRLRLLAAALMWTSGSPYRPRLSSLEKVWHAVQRGRVQTLMGCVLSPRKSCVWIDREFSALPDTSTPAISGAIWDGHWAYAGPAHSDWIIAPLGPMGVAQLPKDIKKRQPSRRLQVQPALFAGEILQATPTLVAEDEKYLTNLRPKFADFLIGH